MSLILSDSNWNVKMTRTPDCQPDKPRTVKTCQIEFGVDSEGQNLTIYIPKPDLDLCALAVEYYMAWLKDSYDEVWPGFKGGLSYDNRYAGFMITPRDIPFNRYQSNPTNLFNGFASNHATTPGVYEPYSLSDFKVVNQESTPSTSNHTADPPNSQNSAIGFDQCINVRSIVIEDRLGKKYKLDFGG
jgi:hypothetical protein